MVDSGYVLLICLNSNVKSFQNQSVATHSNLRYTQLASGACRDEELAADEDLGRVHNHAAAVWTSVGHEQQPAARPTQHARGVIKTTDSVCVFT